MRPSVIALAVVMATCAVFHPGLARADTMQVEGVTVSSTDIEQLRRALTIALKPGDTTIPILISGRSWVNMPRYEKRWHYDGLWDLNSLGWPEPVKLPPGARVMSIWFNEDLCRSRLDAENAIASAFLLALADGGYGGTAFKQLYDIYAARDAQLPRSSSDPFLNRRKYAAALVGIAAVPGDAFGPTFNYMCPAGEQYDNNL